MKKQGAKWINRHPFIVTILFIVFLTFLLGQCVKEPTQVNDYQLSSVVDAFKPQYTLSEIEDLSYAGVKRKSLRIKVPLGLSKAEVKQNIQAAIDDYLSDKSRINAVSVFVYKNTDKELGLYTVASADFAPNGKWADADQFVSYDKNKLVIDYRENYFKKETNPIKLLKIGDSVYIKSNTSLSSKADEWEDNDIIHIVKNKRLATITNKKVFPMGDFDMIRFEVNTGKYKGWVHEKDVTLQK